MPSRIHITAVDALALKLALERMADQSMGNGVTSVFINNTALVDWLMFTVERYAMNDTGFHVGYEKFTAALQIFHGPHLGIVMGATPHSKTVVFPAAFDVDQIAPAQDEHVYTLDDALNFLDKDVKESMKNATKDEIMEEAFDRGLSEGDYCPPDDDFAWQELDHHLNEALANLPSGHFDGAKGQWSLVFPNGDVAHQYDPIR